LVNDREHLLATALLLGSIKAVEFTKKSVKGCALDKWLCQAVFIYELEKMLFPY